MKRLSSHKYWLCSVVITQFVLVISSFKYVITQGQRYIFMDSYDGMRNHFAYHNYINQGKSDDFFLFKNMNYPFGDYILYTDNTPLLAALVKWFSENIYDVSDYSLFIFHWFFTFTIILSSVILYLIGKNLMKTKWLIALFSLTLPWITPQLERLHIGHFSLALSCCIFAVVYGLICLYRNYNNQKSIVLPIIGIISTVVISTFLHAYFLILNGFLIGYFCLFWALMNWKKRIDFAKISGMGLLIPLACLGIAMGIIRSIDTYYPFRKKGANGFYFSEWQLKLDSIYTEHKYSTISSYLKTTLNLHYESIGYIGAFALYGFTLFFIIFAANKFRKRMFKNYLLDNQTGKLVLLLSLSGFACLWIAFGHYAYFFNQKIQFDNWLNPLYFLVKIFKEVTQFRCMGRFNWMFFITINIFVFYILDRYLQTHRDNRYAFAMATVLCLMLCMDTYDSIHRLHGLSKTLNPLTEDSRLQNLRQLTSGINTSKYQAILPLPYYHSSCEDYDYTIDANDKWCTQTFQLATITDLPLMASKMGRTPLNQTHALLDIFINYKIPELVASKLTEQPILVVVNTADYAWNVNVREPANTAFKNGKNFPEKMQLQELKRQNEWILYEWMIKNDAQ